MACSVRREDSPTGGSLQLLSPMSARSTTPDYLSPLCASTRGTTEKLCAGGRKGIRCLTFAEVNEHWGSLSVLWYVTLRKTCCCCWTDSNVKSRPVSLCCIHAMAWAPFWADHWRLQHFKELTSALDQYSPVYRTAMPYFHVPRLRLTDAHPEFLNGRGGWP